MSLNELNSALSSQRSQEVPKVLIKADHFGRPSLSWLRTHVSQKKCPLGKQTYIIPGTGSLYPSLYNFLLQSLQVLFPQAAHLTHQCFHPAYSYSPLISVCKYRVSLWRPSVLTQMKLGNVTQLGNMTLCISPS